MSETNNGLIPSGILLFILATSLLISSSVLADKTSGAANNPNFGSLGGAKFRSRPSLINPSTIGIAVGALVGGVGYAYSKLFQGDLPDVEINKRQDELLKKLKENKEPRRDESLFRKYIKHLSKKDIRRMSREYYRESQGYFFEEYENNLGYVDDPFKISDEDRFLTYDDEDDFFGGDEQNVWKDLPVGMNIVECSGGSGEGGSGNSGAGGVGSSGSQGSGSDASNSAEGGIQQPVEMSADDYVRDILSKPFPQAKEDYEEALAQGKTNANLHRAMIRVARRYKQFDQVEAVYKNGLDRDETSEKFYAEYMRAKGENNRFDLVNEALGKASKEEKIDAFVTAAYMYAAGVSGNFDSIKEYYSDILKNEIGDPLIHRSFIDAARDADQFDQAEMAYDKAIGLRQTDTDVFLAYMKVAGKNKRFDQVEIALEEAISLKQVNADVFIVYIRIMGRNNRFKKAESAFNKAKELGHIEANVIGVYMNVAGKNGDFIQVILAYQLALSMKITNDLIHGNYTFLALRNSRLDYAKAGYDNAIKLKQAGPQVYSSYICVIRKECMVNSANKLQGERDKRKVDLYRLLEDVYKKAIDGGKADAGVYTSYIKAVVCINYYASPKKNYKLALTAYESALAEGKVSSSLYASFIYAAGRFREFNKGIEVYKKAKKEERLTPLVCEAYISEILIPNYRYNGFDRSWIDLAKRTYDEAIQAGYTGPNLQRAYNNLKNAIEANGLGNVPEFGQPFQLPNSYD